MEVAPTLRSARRRSAMSLRELGRAAGTSHSAIAAYESGRKDPTVETFSRLLRAAGFEVVPELVRTIGGGDREARGRELQEALELAAQFPARDAGPLRAPIFGRAN